MIFSHRKKVIEADTLTFELHTEKTFYDRLIDDLFEVKERLYIESPFIKNERAMSLLPYFKMLKERHLEVVIMTRPPRAHKETEREESRQYIRLLRSIGVTVIYSSASNHRKLVIIDDKVLYEGSLNVLSHFNAQEVMRRINSKQLVKETRRVLRI